MTEHRTTAKGAISSPVGRTTDEAAAGGHAPARDATAPRTKRTGAPKADIETIRQHLRHLTEESRATRARAAALRKEAAEMRAQVHATLERTAEVYLRARYAGVFIEAVPEHILKLLRSDPD